jgi:hypothetical protein
MPMQVQSEAKVQSQAICNPPLEGIECNWHTRVYYEN